MWSYSNPERTVLDAVRFEVQDTDEKAQLLQNAEVEYAIREEAPRKPPSQGEVLSAAARCLEALSRRFSAQADTQTGSVSVTYSKAADGYTKRAKELRARAIGMNGVPWAGGQSASEKRALEDQTDRVQPTFKRRQFNAPMQGTGSGGTAGVRPGESESG